MHFFFFFFSPRLSIYMKERVGQSCQIFVTPWTVACQVPLSFKFSRQEYWRGLPFPSPGDGPNPGIKPRPSALQTDSLSSEPPREPCLSNSNSLLGSRLRIFYVTGRNVNHEFQYLKRNYLQILHLLLISG